MTSHLMLAGSDPLTLAEVVSDLDLEQARLVVLSACETGLTDARAAPDEYVGLPAGFLQAGAPAVLASLWPVADLSTSLLVGRFYRLHLGDRHAPASALREAQLWLRGQAPPSSGWPSGGSWSGAAVTSEPPSKRHGTGERIPTRSRSLTRTTGRHSSASASDVTQRWPATAALPDAEQSA